MTLPDEVADRAPQSQQDTTQAPAGAGGMPAPSVSQAPSAIALLVEARFMLAVAICIGLIGYASLPTGQGNPDFGTYAAQNDTANPTSGLHQSTENQP